MTTYILGTGMYVQLKRVWIFTILVLRNGINFHDFGIRHGIDFEDLVIKL